MDKFAACREIFRLPAKPDQFRPENRQPAAGTAIAPAELSMPLHVSIDHELSQVETIAASPLGRSDIESYLDDQATAGVWRYSVLDDLRGVQQWIPSAADIRGIVDRVQTLTKRHGIRGRVAFVVSHDQPALFGMLRMYSILAELATTASFCVFTDTTSARDWLNAGRPVTALSPA